MFFYMSGGAMWTQEVGKMVKTYHHEETGELWGAQAQVQGKVATMQERTYAPTMDPKTYTQCSIPLRWRAMLYAHEDPTNLDLSQAAVRAFWAVGGSWTKRIKTDSEAERLANKRQGERAETAVEPREEVIR